MTITIPIWLMLVMGIPIGIITMIFILFSAWFTISFFKGNWNIWR